MGKAFHMVHNENLQPGNKWYPVVKTYDILICSPGLNVPNTRTIVKQGAKLLCGINAYAIYKSENENSFSGRLFSKMRPYHFFSDSSQPDGLRPMYEQWPKFKALKHDFPGFRRYAETVANLIREEIHSFDGIYIDELNPFIPKNKWKALRITERRNLYWQARWYSIINFFVPYLRSKLPEGKIVIANRGQSENSHGLVYDPRCEDWWGWDFHKKRSLHGVTIEKNHADRMDAKRQNATLEHFTRQFEVNEKNPTYNVDWGNRWEIDGVVYKGFVKGIEETWPEEFREG